MIFKFLNTKKSNWFIAILKKDIKLLIGTIILGLMASLLGMAVAVFSQKLIDTIIPSHSLNKLFIGLSIAAGILLLKIAVTTTQQYLVARHNRVFNLRLIDEFFKSMLFLPKSFFDAYTTGALTARMNDSASIQQTISYIANTLVLNALILIASSFVIFFYSVEIGLIALTTLPLFSAIAIIYKKKIAVNVRKVMEANAKKESNYITTIQNTDIIKTHNKEEMFAGINHDTYGDFQKNVFKSTMTGLSIGSLSELCGTFIYIIMLSYASYQMIIGNLTIGKFTATITITTSMFGPIVTLGFAMLQLQGARIAFDRMYEILSLEPEYNKDQDKRKLCLERVTSVEFNHAFFSYRKDRELLKDLNFKVTRGDMFCIFGKNGCGKSTILKLLMYLYRPDQGEVKFNGIDLKNLSISGVREKIAIVSQQSKLFDKTVIENICLETDYHEAQKAMEFLNSLGFDIYINKLPEGYHTLIYENGENLSGGQKQLISLARALL